MARKNEAEIILTAKDRTKAAFQSVNKGLGRLAAVGLAGAAAGTVLLTREALKQIDVLAKTSQKLGLTTEALTGLRLAAEKTGVSTKQLDLGIQRATRRIAEAAAGTGTAKKALEELGLSAVELAQKSPDEQMRALAEAFKGVTTQADKVRLGFKLFDAEGVALINTLEGGAEALDEAARKTREFGTAISAVEAAEIERANDAATDLKEAFKGLGFDLARRVAPGLEATNTGLAGLVVTIRRDFIPAMAFLLEQTTAYESNVRGLSDIELGVRVEAALDDIAELDEKLGDLDAEARRRESQRPSLLGDVTGNRTRAIRAGLEEELNLEKEAIEARLAEIRGEQERRAEIIRQADQDLADQREQAAEEARQRALEAERIAEEERYQERLDNQIAYQEEQERLREQASRRAAQAAVREAQEFVRQRRRQLQIERQAAEQTVRLRQATAQTVIQTLQTLTAKNKNVARALFLVEKGLAIARTVQNTAAASVKALAELGPIAGPPAAAAITAYGAAQVGLIAATALTGVGQIGAGGGGSIGGGGSLAGGGQVSEPAPPPEPTGVGLEDQGTVQLIFPSLFGITPEAIDALADALREASENRDVVIVGGVGRNAEILGGANG